MPASLSHFRSVGSMVIVPTITPIDFSRPAGFSVAPTELDGKLMIMVGFQPISCALRIACAANFGVPATRNASAPELFRLTTCKSTVGSRDFVGGVDDLPVEIGLQQRLEAR